MDKRTNIGSATQQFPFEFRTKDTDSQVESDSPFLRSKEQWGSWLLWEFQNDIDMNRKSHENGEHRSLARADGDIIPVTCGSKRKLEDSWDHYHPLPKGWIVTSFPSLVKDQLSDRNPTFAKKASTTNSLPSNEPSSNSRTAENSSQATTRQIQMTADLTLPSTDILPVLSEEQAKVLEMVVQQKKSIFFTGSAGTGKSVLLKAMIRSLSAVYGGNVAVTASTGIAACNIGGVTLHSFTGIGLGDKPVKELLHNIKTNQPATVERWKTTAVLIIDESKCVSMIHATLFDKVEQLAREIRENNEPFGGMQVVITGDFFQLPPVCKDNNAKFTFEAKSWNTVIQETITLRHVFRQSDAVFVKILNELRVGYVSDETSKIFGSLSRELQAVSPVDPTELYPLRDDVDKANQQRLDSLTGDVRKYTALDIGKRGAMSQCIAPETIRLKKDTQVMLLKNRDQTLVNGSVGIVIGFAGEGEYKDPMKLLPLTSRPKLLYHAMQRAFPIVRFNTRTIVIEPEKWSMELPGKEYI